MPVLPLGQITVPDIGVDMDSAVTAGITALGTTVALAVGGYLAFLIVRKGLRWLSTAMR